jgi:FkbM family methyltransferase
LPAFAHLLRKRSQRINENQLIAEVEEILSEDPSSAEERARNSLDEVAGPHRRSIVLFGAGSIGRLTLAGLRKAGVEPVAFADNNPQLWGKSVEGVPVFSLSDAVQKFDRTAAFVCAIWRPYGTETMDELIADLHAAGCTVAVPFALLFWKYPEVFAPWYAFDLPHKVLEAADEIREACRIWGDDESRREFLAQIRWRTHLDFGGLPGPVTHETYLPDDLFEIRADEVFIDCGAFDGDSIRSFVKRRGESFGSIESFEPDPANFKRLERDVARLPEPIRRKIRVHPYAVGARTETVRFAARGDEASCVGHGDGTVEVACVDLDHFLSGSVPTYIKMDIEGYEPEGLEGASAIIGRHAPALAICVYHRQDHVWRLPLQMRALSGEYSLFLRPHLLATWDLVCYAVPRARRLAPRPHASSSGTAAT